MAATNVEPVDCMLKAFSVQSIAITWDCPHTLSFVGCLAQFCYNAVCSHRQKQCISGR